MRKARTQEDWNDRYVNQDLPWDSGFPAPELVNTVESLNLSGSVLELGCGTGTNAIWLSQNGFDVTAGDISPDAIEMAKRKATKENLDGKIDFKVLNVLNMGQLNTKNFNFVFDRGCFHSIEDEKRNVFVEVIYENLKSEGLWLSLCGNADDPRHEEGPPKLTANEIVEVVEPRFEIHHIKSIRFRDQEDGHRAWSCLFKRRSKD